MKHTLVERIVRWRRMLRLPGAYTEVLYCIQIKRKKKVASIFKGTFRICLWSDYKHPIMENTVKTQFQFCTGNLLCFSSDSYFTDNRFLADHPEFLVTVLISDSCTEVMIKLSQTFHWYKNV